MTEDEAPKSATIEQIEEAAAAAVPLPKPVGSGEVVSRDPFPATAEAMDHVPPVRDNGRD